MIGAASGAMIGGFHGAAIGFIGQVREVRAGYGQSIWSLNGEALPILESLHLFD